MAKFEFALDGVLRHRKHVEQEKQRELARLQAEMRQAQDALRELNQSTQANVEDVRENHLLGRLDMAFLAAHRRYIFAVQRRALGMAQKMALIQRQIDEAQKALADAAKERKIMEKLRDRQKERWSQDVARREAAELDEVSMRLAAGPAREGMEADQ